MKRYRKLIIIENPISSNETISASLGVSHDISLFVLNLNFETIEINGLAILREIREHHQASIIVLSPIGDKSTTARMDLPISLWIS